MVRKSPEMVLWFQISQEGEDSQRNRVGYRLTQIMIKLDTLGLNVILQYNSLILRLSRLLPDDYLRCRAKLASDVDRVAAALVVLKSAYPCANISK